MIQPLRTVHRRSFIALALVLPAILLIGITARRTQPFPNTRAKGPPVTDSLVRESSGLWRRHTIKSKFYRKSGTPRESYIVLEPKRELNEPDLLLYWSTNSPHGNALPKEARLLGAYAPGRPFVLPFDEAQDGNLILFSMADRAVFDTAFVERLP
jgi:hypothetical protein